MNVVIQAMIRLLPFYQQLQDEAEQDGDDATGAPKGRRSSMYQGYLWPWEGLLQSGGPGLGLRVCICPGSGAKKKRQMTHTKIKKSWLGDSPVHRGGDRIGEGVLDILP